MTELEVREMATHDGWELPARYDDPRVLRLRPAINREIRVEVAGQGEPDPMFIDSLALSTAVMRARDVADFDMTQERPSAPPAFVEAVEQQLAMTVTSTEQLADRLWADALRVLRDGAE